MVGARLDPRVHSEHVTQQSFCNDRTGGSACDDAAFVQHHQLITEHGGMVEVMQRDDAGQRSLCHPPQQLDLMLDLKMVCRLVQQDLGRGLSQSAEILTG